MIKSLFQNLQATLEDNFSEIEFKIGQLESRVSAIESIQHEDQATLQVQFSTPPSASDDQACKETPTGTRSRRSPSQLQVLHNY